MIREAIKQLWRAKTRVEASNALDTLESRLDGNWGSLSAIEFGTIMEIISIKGRYLSS